MYLRFSHLDRPTWIKYIEPILKTISTAISFNLSPYHTGSWADRVAGIKQVSRIDSDTTRVFLSLPELPVGGAGAALKACWAACCGGATGPGPNWL